MVKLIISIILYFSVTTRAILEILSKYHRDKLTFSDITETLSSNEISLLVPQRKLGDRRKKGHLRINTSPRSLNPFYRKSHEKSMGDEIDFFAIEKEPIREIEKELQFIKIHHSKREKSKTVNVVKPKRRIVKKSSSSINIEKSKDIMIDTIDDSPSTVMIKVTEIDSPGAAPDFLILN